MQRLECYVAFSSIEAAQYLTNPSEMVLEELSSVAGLRCSISLGEAQDAVSMIGVGSALVSVAFIPRQDPRFEVMLQDVVGVDDDRYESLLEIVQMAPDDDLSTQIRVAKVMTVLAARIIRQEKDCVGVWRTSGCRFDLEKISEADARLRGGELPDRFGWSPRFSVAKTGPGALHPPVDFRRASSPSSAARSRWSLHKVTHRRS